MDRFMTRRRAQAHQETGNNDDGRETVDKAQEIVRVDSNGNEAGGESSPLLRAEGIEKPVPSMGMKVRRRAYLLKECHGDYVDVPSDPYLSKILRKQGDRRILFADRVLKFTGTGKIKRRILLITDFAIYLIDPDSDAMKRRIALSAVDKLLISELNDNFFAVVIPSEYDCLLASTRKAEIVNALLEANKNASERGLEVFRSNRFAYNVAADTIKEVEFEEVDGSIRARFRRKEK